MICKREIFIAVFFLAAGLGFAKEITIPSLEPAVVIQAVNDDGTEQEYFTGQQIINYSLKFSLCQEDSEIWISSFEKYNQIKELCIQNQIMELDEITRAEKLNEWMYEFCLSKYNFHQTKVDVMLTEGIYNCVSSSLLYMALASDFGIDARVQETPNHAFITVYIGDKKIDIETTNPHGFDPGRKKYVGETKSGAQKYAVIPKTYYANRKEVSQREAISLVGKNLCSSVDKQSDYVTGVPLGISIYEFVNAEKNDARYVMETMVSNFASFAGRNKQNEAALDFMDEYFEKYGTSDFVVSNYTSLLHNSIADFCNADLFEQARETLEKRRKNIPEATYNKMEKIIFQQEVYDTVGNLFDEEKFLEAADFCTQALQKFPQDRTLMNLKSDALKNHSIAVHNSLMPYVKEKRYEEAIEIIEAALELNPDNYLLKIDLENLKKKILSQ